MSGSENTGLPEKQATSQKSKDHSADDKEQAAAKIIKQIIPADTDTYDQYKQKHGCVQCGCHHIGKAGNSFHVHLSLGATLACIFLCGFVPMAAVFFGPVLLIAGILAMIVREINIILIGTLDILRRGRLIAMLAAVALYPPLSLEQVRFFMWHPLALLAGDVPPGLLPAFAFAMLCAAQTALATVLMIEAIPPRRVYAALRRVADGLPAGMARWLRYRIALGERRFNLDTGDER